MPDHPASGKVAVLSPRWDDPHDEGAFVLRSVAAALSRLTDVQVVSTGDPAAARPDGTFDVRGVGGTCDGGWPEPARATWHSDLGSVALAVADGADQGARALLDRFAPGIPVVAVAAGAPDDSTDESTAGRPDHRLMVGVGAGDPHRVGLHLPVHPMARTQSHVGLGFTGYVLVLSDRRHATDTGVPPTPLAAWLAARFGDRHLVVLEDGVASVWRWRSLRGLVAINTRADLWRLMAHARVTVDLAPGGLVARECVESLRYEVPIVVPAATAAARLAAAGGGLWYTGVAELLACIEALDDHLLRDALAHQGKVVADQWYGDPGRFAERVRLAAIAWFSEEAAPPSISVSLRKSLPVR